MAGTIATPEPSTGADPAVAVVDRVRRGYAGDATPGLTGAAARLRDDLVAGGLEVHYQPIVSLPDRRLQGFEALARVRTRSGRLLTPDAFIEVAEAAGLIVPLGLEVLGTAVATLARWRHDPTMAGAYVSVNVSPTQLTEDTFVTTVRDVLRSGGLPASAVMLEVTEGHLAGRDVQRTMAVVEATGVRLALDDFGTGFATLDNLRRLPVHMLKLDRSFVQGIGNGGLDTVIVRNVLDLAYELDLTVVAEGVETQEQAASLASWGCAAAQGFLFGRPAPRDGVTTATADPAASDEVAPATADHQSRTTTVAVARTLALGDTDGDDERSLIHAVATGIGKAMRLPAATINELGLAALCHDIARLRPLLGTDPGVAQLPAALAALLDPAAAPGDQRLMVQLVRIAVDTVTAARANGRGPQHGGLTDALQTGAAGRPHGIAHAMRRLAEHLPSTHADAHVLLSAGADAPAEVQSTTDRLHALRSLSRAVDPSADSRTLVGMLADEALDIVGAASLSLSRWERDEGLLRVLVNVGRLADAEVRYPDDETYLMTDYVSASRLLAAGVPHIERLADEHGDPQSRELLRRHGKGSAAAVPVYTNERLWGELYVTTALDEPPFVARDLELLTALADILGGALTYGEQLERMARLAFEDPLTGLANRRAIDDRLEQALRRSTDPVTVIMLDVNGLKQVNDEYGHATGDKALRAVADALSGATLDLPDATSARLGGDEFCVVVVGSDGGTAERIVNRAVSQLRAAPAPQVTISAGAASSTRAGRTVRELFAAADRAQYQAKRTGHTLLLAGAADAVGTDSTATAGDRRDRRSNDLRVGAAVATPFDAVCGRVVEILGDMAHATARDVLDAVGVTMAEGCDLGRLLLSHIDDRGVIRIEHLRLRRTRPVTHRDRVVPPEEEIYHLDDFPMTRAAVDRAQPFWVHVDDPDHDAAERGVLEHIGMTAVLGMGAQADDGGWLLELYADEHTDDLSAFLPLARMVSRSLQDGR
jgi:diguanylate cyclase (GGDEF)-like protein